MLKRMNLVLALAVCMTLGAAFGTAVSQKQNVPKTPDKLVIGQEQVRQLLLLMDTDKDGMISKQEWMNYMSAEFDKLDTDKSGKLDQKELTYSSVRASHPVYAGK
jgi:hypothetical protein